MSQRRSVLLRYQGPCGGYLRIDIADGKGYLQLSKELPTDASPYCFEEKTVDWAHQHEVVTLKSCEHTTKYITGYGTGFSYVVNGEPTMSNGLPNNFSYWEIRSYEQITGVDQKNWVVLYNSFSKCYFVITPDLEFLLSDNMDDVKCYGAFVIDSLPTQ